MSIGFGMVLLPLTLLVGRNYLRNIKKGIDLWRNERNVREDTFLMGKFPFYEDMMRLVQKAKLNHIDTVRIVFDESIRKSSYKHELRQRMCEMLYPVKVSNRSRHLLVVGKQNSNFSFEIKSSAPPSKGQMQ